MHILTTTEIKHGTEVQLTENSAFFGHWRHRVFTVDYVTPAGEVVLHDGTGSIDGFRLDEIRTPDATPPRLAPLCDKQFGVYDPHPIWIKPGEPQSITAHLADVADNLHIDIRYDIDVTNDWSNYEPVITPSYRGQAMRDLYPKNHTIDLRYINQLFLVLREHLLDGAGRPSETLIDVYQMPLTEAMPL